MGSNDTVLPQGDDLAQEANDYANEAIAASKYTIPPGAWRSLLRDMVQEAYLDGFRRVRDANQTTLLERTSQPEDAVTDKMVEAAAFAQHEKDAEIFGTDKWHELDNESRARLRPGIRAGLEAALR